MSDTLYWKIIPAEPKEHGINDLKYIMQEKYEHNVDEIAGRELIPFLEGIVAGNSSGEGQDAQDLINAIEKHGEVQVFTHG